MRRIRFLMLALLIVLAGTALWHERAGGGRESPATHDAVADARTEAPSATPSPTWPSPSTSPEPTSSSAAAPRADASADAAAANADDLPREARTTLALIAAGGPFPYDRDGVEFRNFEHRLPARPRGWYHEYTVPTPGVGHRGARRIVTGGNPPQAWYYTDDHYRSFREIGGAP
jgi:guanyl-specific ribonuclease Sa